MKQKNRAVAADFGLFFTALIWGASFVVVKQSIASISPLWLLAARFTIAALAMLIVFFPRLKKLKFKTFLSGALAGVFVYFGFLSQTVAVQHTTASKNAVLTASYAVFVPFVYWIIKRQRPKLSHIISALLCFAGVALLMYQKDSGFFSLNKGDLYTLLCGLFFAIQIAYLGIASKKHDTVLLAVIQMVTCCVISVAAAFAFDMFPTQMPSGEMWVSIAYLGLLSTFAAYLIQTTSQKYSPPSHVSIILSLECLFGCVLSVIAFKETFTPLMWLGAALTFAAVIVSEHQSKG